MPPSSRNPRDLEGYEGIKFGILGEAVSDSWGMWEVPLFDPPDLTDRDLHRLTQAVLSDLYEDNLIFFFHESPNFDADPQGPTTHLPAREVKTLLSKSEWRVQPGVSNVALFATPRGEETWQRYAKATWPKKTRGQRPGRLRKKKGGRR